MRAVPHVSEVKAIHANPLKRGRKLAAILLEPLQGEGGITPATTEFFSAARELCDEYGALLMADEVQTGMGRTGQMWGYMQHGLEVDVLTTAKALGGGVPIGAMLCKESCAVFSPVRGRPARSPQRTATPSPSLACTHCRSTHRAHDVARGGTTLARTRVLASTAPLSRGALACAHRETMRAPTEATPSHAPRATRSWTPSIRTVCSTM